MFYLVDAELKSEDKICIDNKSKIEDGPSFPLKMNHVEFSESKFLLNFIIIVLLINYKYNYNLISPNFIIT